MIPGITYEQWLFTATDVICRAKYHYERTRDGKAFNMPATGDEGVVKKHYGYRWTVYTFDDGSKLHIRDKSNCILWSMKGKFMAQRTLWPNRRNE